MIVVLAVLIAVVPGIGAQRLTEVGFTAVVALIVFSTVRWVARARRVDATGAYWERMLRVQRFVGDNGFTYEQDADARRYSGLAYGRSPRLQFVTVVRDFERTLTVGNLVFARSAGTGERRREPLARGILMLAAPQVTLPELVFEAVGTALPLAGAGLERRELEGDFSASYLLWHPPGYGLDALQVVQPDVMASLIDVADGLSVEIIDGCLIVSWPRALRIWDAEDAEQAWRVAEMLRSALVRMPDSWRDERDPSHPERVAVRDLRRRAGLVG